MLGFFPDPYPDELLYSACARYAKRSSYLNKRSVINELFGRKGISAIMDFPTRLRHFVSVLPKNHNYTVKKLIAENTLFPFHEPFLSSERVEIVRNEIRGESNNKIQTRLGTKVKQIKNPKYLRFCPDCVKDDRRQYGETYWHRIHQLGGISVCPNHHCFLRDSSIELGRYSAKVFHEAEESIPTNTDSIKYLNLQNKNHQILLKISEDAKWLLSSSNLQINSENIRDRYFNILLKQGFAYYNGKLKRKELLDAFQNFFSTEVFELSGKISDDEDWLSFLVDKGNVNKTYHPIRHLLFMTFLGYCAKDFLTAFIEYKPFNNPPYPCLNTASDHYKEFCIQDCQVFDNITKDARYRGPIAIFRCQCGFIYQRLGPDQSEQDKFRYSSIKEYGFVWERTFDELWADLSLSLAEIARRTGISQASVGRHAIRLNVPMNSEGTRSLQGYDRHRNPKITYSEMVQKYRKLWLETRAKYPNLTRRELLNVENFVYLWLKRNDSEWFTQNLPKPAKKGAKVERLDWSGIDKTLSEKIKSVCQEIKSSSDFLIRVSITEIIRRVGNKTWIEKRKKKLPLTSKVIDEGLETLEDFMIRKVRATAKVYIMEKKLPTLAQFEARAVIRNSTARNSPKVKKAIKKALSEIREALSS